MRIDELAAAFLAATRHQYSANTHRAYRTDLGQFAHRWPDLQATAVTVVHLRSFLADPPSLAPATRARRRAALRACFGWAYRHDLVVADPTGKLERLAAGEQRPRPLTEDQVEAILAAIPSAARRDRLLFTLLAETGLRIGEALALHHADVRLNDIDGGYLRVVGKGDRERIIPLIDAARTLKLLRALLRPAGQVGPLFRGDPRKGGRPGEPLDYTTVLHHFTRYVAAAHARQPALFADERLPITIHRFRHTYATTKLRDGVSLPVVRKLLGHQHVQTTLRYAETDLQMMQQELVAARRRRGKR